MPRSGVAGRVPAQVTDGAAQAPGEAVEDAAQGGEMGLLAQPVEEAGQVPAVGELRLGGDAEQAAQGGVAVEFGQAGVEGGVPRDDGQQHDPPDRSPCGKTSGPPAVAATKPPLPTPHPDRTELN